LTFIPFIGEEVEGIIASLKDKKAAGHDGLQRISEVRY
jgi:hypothetical protein